jgi:regulator of sirC expression with transglutaminase-like and TPR domain
MMERDDDQIDLAEAALLIACTEYPQLERGRVLKRLDELASQLTARPENPPLSNIGALNELLFEKEGLSGDEEQYDDPRNSFLNDVLDRKKGIPITLSLVYMEVARRRELPVVGVGFPGHFLVKYLTATAEIVIDPFHRGALLSREDCLERLQAHFGNEAELKPDYLAASTHKQILARMLNNLKGSYFRRHMFAKVLTMIEMSLSIDPGSRQDIRDRGMVYFAMKRYREDQEVREALKKIHQIRAVMN